MKKLFTNGKTARFIYMLAVSISAIASYTGCSTMGEQFLMSPFPGGSTVYIKPEIHDVYGSDKTIGWFAIEKAWKDIIISELNKKSYVITENRNDAAFELIMRSGNTRRDSAAGMIIVSSGFRIEILQVKSGNVVLNKWEEKPVNFSGKYVGDNSIIKFLTEFTQKSLLDLPAR